MRHSNGEEVGVREAPCSRGPRGTVRFGQEDGCAICTEENHGVLDEPVEDLFEVQPAADVGGDESGISELPEFAADVFAEETDEFCVTRRGH